MCVFVGATVLRLFDDIFVGDAASIPSVLSGSLGDASGAWASVVRPALTAASVSIACAMSGAPIDCASADVIASALETTTMSVTAFGGFWPRQYSWQDVFTQSILLVAHGSLAASVIDVLSFLRSRGPSAMSSARSHRSLQPWPSLCLSAS